MIAIIAIIAMIAMIAMIAIVAIAAAIRNIYSSPEAVEAAASEDGQAAADDDDKACKCPEGLNEEFTRLAETRLTQLYINSIIA